MEKETTVVKVYPKWTILKGLAIATVAYCAYEAGKLIQEVRRTVQNYNDEDKKKT